MRRDKRTPGNSAGQSAYIVVSDVELLHHFDGITPAIEHCGEKDKSWRGSWTNRERSCNNGRAKGSEYVVGSCREEKKKKGERKHGEEEKKRGGDDDWSPGCRDQSQSQSQSRASESVPECPRLRLMLDRELGSSAALLDGSLPAFGALSKKISVGVPCPPGSESASDTTSAAVSGPACAL